VKVEVGMVELGLVTPLNVKFNWFREDVQVKLICWPVCCEKLHGELLDFKERLDCNKI
jgi:hypothetical protein